MATESKVHVTPSVQPEFAVANLSAETAELASRILSENHEKFHIYFNDAGFHSMSLVFFLDFMCCAPEIFVSFKHF